jgi:hypothetical protein
VPGADYRLKPKIRQRSSSVEGVTFNRVSIKMRKRQLLAALIGLAVVVFTLGCKSSGSQTLTLEIPKTAWEPHFFQDLEIRTTKVGMTSLRKTLLPEGDLEMRFWYVPFPAIHGVIIKRSGKDWSASFLRERKVADPSSVELLTLEPPKSGWENVWQRLKDLGVLTLPDRTNTTCEGDIMDGSDYIVETNVDHKYRTYRYGNPRLSTCDEAKRIVAIAEIIWEEFRLSSLK